MSLDSFDDIEGAGQNGVDTEAAGGTMEEDLLQV